MNISFKFLEGYNNAFEKIGISRNIMMLMSLTVMRRLSEKWWKRTFSNIFIRQIVVLRFAVIFPEFKIPQNICFSDNLMSLDILKENFINPALADIISNFTPQDRQNNRKAPASPHTTRAGGADRNGHSGRVKSRRGGRRTEEGWGLE